MGAIAKALVPALATALVLGAKAIGVELEISVAETIVGGLVTTLLTYAIPNTPSA